jgi:ABC-type sugar transport system ATPase subunit
MLEIEALTARAGTFRLTGINLAVGAGECHAVLGPSGAGKSTLLHAVMGTLSVESGRIRLGGAEITRLPVERRRLGYVPQQLGLFPHLSVHDNLTYSARARHVPRREFEPLLKHLVDITSIGSLLDRVPATLSGGERQRVALVRALASNPHLVLLDEPFTALNESLRRELWWLVKDLQRERNLSVLLVTHDLTEAYFLASHITVLIDGRQEQSGSREEVYRRPATLAVARFLGLRNLFAAAVTRANDAGIEAWCPMLRHGFRLSGRAVPGTPIRLGIRPENVVLRDAAHPPRPGECVLTGQIRLTDLDADVAIQCSCAGLAAPIEITASRRVAARFGLTDGREGVSIGLPEAEMFWLHDA